MCFIVILVYLFYIIMICHLLFIGKVRFHWFVFGKLITVCIMVKVFLLEYEFNMKDTNYYFLVHCNYTCKYF